MEAIYREMRKLGVTSGTTTEFTLHAASTGSRQASVTELDNQPKSTTSDACDAAVNGVALPPVDIGRDLEIYLFICMLNQWTGYILTENL